MQLTLESLNGRKCLEWTDADAKSERMTCIIPYVIAGYQFLGYLRLTKKSLEMSGFTKALTVAWSRFRGYSLKDTFV